MDIVTLPSKGFINASLAIVAHAPLVAKAQLAHYTWISAKTADITSS